MRKVYYLFVGFMSFCVVSHAQKATTTPVSSSESRSAAAGWSNGRTWMDQHNDINKIGEKGEIELVFLGNSITQSWGGEGRQVWFLAQQIWKTYYGNRKAANFGISGDRTQHILWRIENGNFDNISPKVIVLMAGTNNIGHDTPKAIGKGVKMIVKKLQQKCPETNILLLGIFPRGKDIQDPLRKKVQEVNQQIARLDHKKGIMYKDIGVVFLDEDGKPNPDLMRSDFLHLHAKGYGAWAKAIEPALKNLLGE